MLTSRRSFGRIIDPAIAFDKPMESRPGQQCKLPEIAVHTEEIRQTRILAKLKNSC